MKKKYPNLMMQSASSYDTTKVKEAVEQQVKEEQAQTADPIATNVIEAAPATAPDQDIPVIAPIAEPAPVIATQVVIKKDTKPRLRQQAYYLTEIEIKTIKRLSYELDIPKSDLVRKFIDEGIARIEESNK